MNIRRTVLVASLALMTGLLPAATSASRGTQSPPKLLNLYLGWQIKDADQAPLAQWDIVVLDMDQQWQSPDRIRQLRQDNPRIKILAYVSAGELSTARASGDHASPGYLLSQRAAEAFYMHSSNGSRLSWWPGAELMNATDLGPAVEGQRWADVLPAFVRDDLMSTGLWDGVFLDGAYSDITSFFGKDIDPDGDGKANPSRDVNAAEQAGMSRLIRNMRAAVGPGRLIMNNSSTAYASLVNGVLFENFPTYGWAGPFKDYLGVTAKNVAPTVSAINTDTSDRDTPTDYRLMRLGMGSALMGDGYYSFDAGPSGHDRAWWYDEYDATLGAPKGAAKLVAGKGSGTVPGIWMREYERGIVLVNSDTVPRHADLPGAFEKIRGTQDPRTNDGKTVRSVDVPAQDGIILLGRAESAEIGQGTSVGGAFIRAFSAEGEQVRNGFFADTSGAPNGAVVVRADLDRSGSESVVYAVDGSVTVKSPSGKSLTFRPFGKSYKGKLSIAVGNTNRDADLEIVVGRDKAAPSDVRVFSRTGKHLAAWTAYTPAFAGGARVAIGDLDGDGMREIVTGAGPGGGPHIRIFKTDGKDWGGSFFAFDTQERGGVSVAVGDVDGDAKDEIIVGSGEGAVPRVRIFDVRGTLKRELTFGSQPILGGLTVTAADITGDGIKEILVGGLPAI